MSKVLKNTFIYTIGNILPKIAGFILLPIYLHHLTPKDYGIVNSMNVLQTILAVIFSFALERSVLRLYYDYDLEEDKTKFLGTISVSIFFISTGILVLVLLTRSLFQKIFASIDFFPFYLYAILTGYILAFFYIPKAYLMLKEKALSFISLSIVQFLTSSGFILFFIISRGQGAIGMLKGQLLGAIVIMPWTIFFAIKHFKLNFNFKMFKNAFAYSWPGIPTLLSAWVLNLSDRVFIARYFTLSDVGIYSLGYKIAGLGLLLFTAMNMAYKPLFFKLANSANQISARKQIEKYNSLFIYVVIAITFALVFFSKEIVYFFFDKRYESSYHIVVLISISYMFVNINSIFGGFLQQSKKVKQGMIIDIGTAILNIILNLLLIPRFGFYGAAYATIISFFSAFVIAYFYSMKYCYFVPVSWKYIWITIIFLGCIVLVFSFLINVQLIIGLLIKVGVVFLIATFFFWKFFNEIKSFLRLRSV